MEVDPLVASFFGVDSGGQFLVQLAPSPGPIYFNGGRPLTSVFRQIVITFDEPLPSEKTAGRGFKGQALSVHETDPIVSFVNGLPLTAKGQVAGEFGQPVTHNGNMGYPYTASGRIAFAALTPPPNLSGFTNGFDGGFG